MQHGYISGGRSLREKLTYVRRKIFFGVIAIVFFCVPLTAVEAKVDCQKMMNYAMKELGLLRYSGHQADNDPYDSDTWSWWSWENRDCTLKSSFCERFVERSFHDGGGGTNSPVPNRAADSAYYGLAGYPDACSHAKHMDDLGEIRTDWENMKPGDIVFWAEKGPCGNDALGPNKDNYGHVGIVVGDYNGKKDQYISATSWNYEYGNCNKPGGVIIHGVFDNATTPLFGYQSMGCDGVVLPPGGSDDTAGGMCIGGGSGMGDGTSSADEAAALRYARSKLGSNQYPGLCERLVREATKGPSYCSAMDHWNNASNSGWTANGYTCVPGAVDGVVQKGIASTDMSKIKPGDIIFFPVTTGNAPYGHVGIYSGNGKYISAVHNSNNQPEVMELPVSQYGKPPLGWAPP